MNERSTRRQPRASVDDPYTKPWVARDAAKNVVRQGIAAGRDPSELIDRQEAIFRHDYAAVVGRFAAIAFHPAPDRAIAPDEIGVTGFAPEGDVFPLAEVWHEVTGEAMPPSQPALVDATPGRRRRKGVAP
jgi:hypothetical protein